MIKSKKDLKRYIGTDNSYVNKLFYKKSLLISKIVLDESLQIKKYLKFLRKQEYYINVNNGDKIKKFLALYYERKKNSLGNKLGFYIGPNCFKSELTIYHHGSIIVNPGATIGTGCKLHGNNCIGNNGIDNRCPSIGNNVDIGFGAVIIGDIQIADDIVIGANSVVTKSFKEKGITIAGVPAKKI